jgi:hypothetical protein
MTVNILTSRNLWQIAPPRTVLVIQFPGVLSRAAANVKRLQGRVGEQEKALGEFELYVAEHHTSQEFLNDLKREITDSLRDLGRSRRRQRFSAISSAFGLEIAAMARTSNRNSAPPPPSSQQERRAGDFVNAINAPHRYLRPTADQCKSVAFQTVR